MVNYAKQNIDQIEFIRFFRIALNETAVVLNEMSIYKASQTGLKMNIQIDDTLSAEKSHHNLDRIKFQPAQGLKKSSDFIPMLVDDGQYDEKNVTIKYSEKDIKKLKDFLLLNKKYIKQLYKKEISQDEFEAKMITFDKSGKPIFPKIDSYSCIAGPNCYGFIKVKLQSGKYAFENKYGQLAFEDEFDEAEDFSILPNGKIGTFVKKGKLHYILYDSGKMILQGI